MERFAFFVLAIAMVVGVLMPSSQPSSAQMNQQVMIDAPSAGEQSPQGTHTDAVDQTTISPSFGGETILDRGPGGHFYSNATVNGTSLPFVIDTGATSVALTVDAARAAGIYVDPSSFTVVGAGASGATRGMRVTISRLEVAGRRVENVEAVVLEGLPVNLLGQSILTRLGSVQMSGDKMVLR